MSVTFNLKINDADFLHFEITDLETERSWTAPDYDAAVKLWHELGASPQGYWTFSPCYNTDSSRDVQMSNSHAEEILELLGLPGTILGATADPLDFRGRCLVALALAPTTAMPAAEEIGPKGAKLLLPSRPAGYVQDKLTALVALSELAEASNRLVSWG